MNAARWLDKLNLSPTARLLVNQRIRSRYDEPSRLSLLYLAQQGRAYRGVDDRDLRAARLPGGSQVLAEAFVKQIKTIKTKSKVSSIVQAKDGVAVKAGSETYKADYVVLAVPLKALGQIQMTPSLSGTQMSALKGTNYGWRPRSCRFSPRCSSISFNTWTSGGVRSSRWQSSSLWMRVRTCWKTAISAGIRSGFTG